VRAHAPRASDVVLEPGAADRRKFPIAIEVHLDLAFAVPPATVDRPHADHTAEETARSAQAVDDGEVVAHGCRVLAPERDVQVGGVRRQLVLQRVVDLEVQLRAPGRLVAELDAHAVAERHREVRVEPAPFRDDGEQRRVIDRPAVRRAEEIEQRHADARFREIVVEHVEQERAQLVGRRGRHGAPEMTDGARSLDVGEGDRRAGRDHSPGRALAAAVGSAARTSFTRRVLERDRTRLE
jgi:hypothetical protein